jgi:hypothetical protein
VDRTLTIERRFCGPPESGNGGYVAGLLAAELGGSDCEVVLRAPPPLGRPLQLRNDGEVLLLSHGDQVIATAAPASVNMLVPGAPPLSEAHDASSRFAGFHEHPFPGCFVCGPARKQGDGLRIFPGAITGSRVAAVWSPSADLCDPDGPLAPQFTWAALDCPGYFATFGEGSPALLGKIAVHIEEPIDCSEPLVVAGWPLDSSGRKHRVGTALYRAERPVAWAIATWVSPSSDVTAERQRNSLG